MFKNKKQNVWEKVDSYSNDTINENITDEPTIIEEYNDDYNDNIT